MVESKNLLSETISKIQKLNQYQLQEVNDFASFLLYKQEAKSIAVESQYAAMNNKAFNFLKEEEDLYTIEHLKESYK